MDDRFPELISRREPKDHRPHTKLLEGLAAIIVIVATASTIYTAVNLLPTMLHAILPEFGAYIVPKARG